MTKTEKRFRAIMKIAGVNPYVDVPRQIADALPQGAKARVLVRPDVSRKNARRKQPVVDDALRLKAIARLDDEGWFRTTLVASRSGPPRLYLDQWMREVAGVGLGDQISLRLKPDPASRVLAMPAQFRQALNIDTAAKAAWNALAPSRRREILTYLRFLKRPDALARNVRQTIARLSGKGRA